MTEVERRAALDAIGVAVSACTRCRLHETRTKAVPGEGTSESEVIFVGEGPGYNEDKQGRPFVGQAGTLLNELLGVIGWSRDVVFITNVVKCRPPENRDPEAGEIAACAPFLTRQLEALDPALVVTLGRFSMARFNPGARISQVHGTVRRADSESGAPNALTFSMYHPAAALHQQSLRETLFRDMEGIPAALLAARKMRAEGAGDAERSNGAKAAAPIASVDTWATPAPASVPAAPPSACQVGQNVPTDAESDRTDQIPLF